MEITNISSLDRSTFLNQDYTPKDEILLNALEVNSEFGNPEDKIEVHIIGPNDEIIESVYDFRNYKITNTVQDTSLFNQLELDPKSDLESFGYFSGQYDINYNFYRQLFLSSYTSNYFISEISSDRTEIKITNNDISYTELGQFYLNYIATRNSRNFYSDFILNFGSNDTYIAVNVALDNVNTNIPSLYIKLYEPLPSEIGIKDTLWLVESISEPYSFRVSTDFIAEDTNTTIPLKGPNINIDLNDKINLTTPYLNLSNLLTNSSTSSYQQLQSWLDEKSIEITIDYTDFSSFVHFSSATERLDNFKYKLTQIQSLQADIDALSSVNPLAGPTYINSNKAILQTKLDTLIQKLDGYEYYLYYETGSKAWPKTNTVKPYINVGVNDPQAKTWFGSANENSNYYGGEILSASNFDVSNRDYIWNNLPDYIKGDPQNANLELFTSMLGQHYDYIWTYIKDITDIQVADNRLDFGISKDLVADTLRSFGIKLYTNSRNQDDIYSSLLGVNAEGSFLPSTGSYLIDTYVTASQYTIPDNDIVRETYKRIYHNMPYLLKTRGTRAGLRALINCFGIPETILKVREFGGLDKDSNNVTTFYEKFAYGFNTNGSSSLSIPWLPLNSQYLDTTYRDIVPDTLEFRFKTPGIPEASHYSQSLFYVTSPSEGLQFGVQLLYPSGTNASYNTNELNEAYSKYGELRFFLSGSNGYINTTPLYLPFFNGDWWNVKLNRETGSLRLSQTGSDNTYILSAKNSIYNGYNGISVGFEGSASVFISGSTSSSYNRAWSNYTTFDVSQPYGYDSPLALYDFDFTLYDDNTIEPPYFGYLGGDGTHNSPLAPNNIFSGSFQEFRYWIGNLENTSFNDHTLHPRSIVGNNPSASYSELSFRLPLGNELDNNLTTYLTSAHPTIAGNQITSSFLFESGSTSVVLSTAKINNLASALYETTVYTSLINIPNIGAITEVDGKVRITEPNLIPGDVLTPYISIQKPGDIPYTNDLSIVDISLSPQDSINEDIIAQLGTFNIDEYIGDPRLSSLSSYPALTELRNFYFQKYSRSQNIFDLIKLLSYFDNSLFKMIKDFVPAKANLSTGLTIKPHILERNKMERHEPTFTFVDHSGSIETAFISGSNGLNLNLNTDYTEIISNDLLPTFPFNHTDRRELFTGELGGSEVTVYYPESRSVVFEPNKLNVSTSIAIVNRFSELPFQPTLNNILNARTSNNYLDVDYSSNPNTPVNINFLSASLALSLRTTAFPFLDAPVQDSNYTLKRHTQPRYEGSRLFGNKYNVYSPNDISYGSDPVINLNSVKFAYFDTITSQSATLNGRSNINIKYLIDSASNIVELTEANNNLFDVQDIFNKTNANIALDNANQPSNQKSLNGLKPIYAGGFRYEPILINLSTPISEQSKLDFIFQNDIEAENPDPNSQVTAPINNGLNISLLSLVNTPTVTLNNSGVNISFNIDSAIRANVTRNTTFAGEIRQRISGTIQCTVKIFPNNTYTTRFYNNYTGEGTPFRIQVGPYSNTWLDAFQPNDPLSSNTGISNRVGAIRIEPGVEIQFANWDNNFSIATYNTYTPGYNFNYAGYGWTGTAVNGLIRASQIGFLPLILGDNGIDRIIITSTSNTSITYNSTQIQNSFGTAPTTNLNSNTVYTIPDAGLEFNVTFPIQALLVLPAGVGSTTQAVNVNLRSLSNQEGNIKINNNFPITNNSKAVLFQDQPTNITSLGTSGTSYYLTEAPDVIFITGSSDNGYLSGSISSSVGLNNWYFERGNKVVSGSVNTLLTASYDLSLLYYNNISNPLNEPNYFTQTLLTASIAPTGSFTQPTEYYIPKVGDLIKFYNHDKAQFPYAPLFERELIGIYSPQTLPIGSGSNGTGSYANRLVFEVSGESIPNQACYDFILGEVGKIVNLIHLSKIPDETNIIINHEKNPGLTSAGILYTEDITPELKKEAGNIIKGLKSQNLI